MYTPQIRKGLLRAVLITHDYKESVKIGVGPVQQDGEHFGCRELERTTKNVPK